MERLLQYAWKYKLYEFNHTATLAGKEFVILDVGICNSDAGPDFFNAKIKIDDKVWVGNVEIHERSSDWYRHNHHSDPAYNSVILHVVETIDREDILTNNGIFIPQIQLQIRDDVRKRISGLMNDGYKLNCADQIHRVDRMTISSWMSALMSERLERKMNDVLRVHKQSVNDWNEAFFVMLLRSFGFGINSEPMELLSKTLSYKHIYKHRDSLLQIEALLLGQAGFLEEETSTDLSYFLLQREYHFLKHKYNLHTLDPSLFKRLRTRPSGFPHIKLAMLAALLYQHEHLFSWILEQTALSSFYRLFSVQASEYWDTHYSFDYPSPNQKKQLGKKSINSILINAVIPSMFAYGSTIGAHNYMERALYFMEQLEPEDNSIVRQFCDMGIEVRNASDTQALIQLRKEYCDKKKCLYCRIGFKVLSIR